GLIKGGRVDRFIYTEGIKGKAVRVEDKYKYIRWKRGFARTWLSVDGTVERQKVEEELYDLKNDAEEENNLAGKDTKLLQQMRNLLGDFTIKEPMVNRLIFTPGDDTFSGNIEAEGKIIILKTVDPPSEIHLAEDLKNLRFKITPRGSRTELLFEVQPPGAAVKISIYINGKKLSKEKILIGALSLPLKPNPMWIDAREDNPILKADPFDPFDKLRANACWPPEDTRGPWVHFSRIPYEDWTHPVRRKTKITNLGVRGVLEGWGYISPNE
ncbi:unnamed protein product, partial [marine sediment metagenome]